MLCARVSIASASVLAFAGVACADTITYRLDNHPNGEVIPPPYGLRLDGLFGGTEVVTFSFSGNGAGMFLDYDTVANSIHIHGTVFGGIDGGDSFVMPTLFSVDVLYTLGVTGDPMTGWDVGKFDNNGTITRLSDSMSWPLTTRGNDLGHTFEFHPDRYRLGGDLPDIDWVGRGWLRTPGSNLTQDFLFIGELVPLPPAVWTGIFGLLGVGAAQRVMRRRERR